MGEVGEMFEEKLDTFNDGCDDFLDDESQSVMMMSLQPKILQETENSSSMRCLEMILLKRLLSIKELKMKRMKERLEEQQNTINDLNRRIKILESGWHQNLLTHINVTVNFLHGSVILIFNWVYSLVFSAVQSIKLPINPRIIVIRLARVVASAAHSVGEIAENIENGNIEALVEEEVTSDISSHKTTKRKSVRN